MEINSTVRALKGRKKRFVFISKFCVFADRHRWWGHSGRQTFIWRGFQGFPYDRFKHFTQIFLPYILNKSTNTQLIKDTEYRKTKITLPPPNTADLPCLKPSNGHMAEQFTSQSWPSVCKHSCPWACAADGLFSSVTEKSHTVFSFRKKVSRAMWTCCSKPAKSRQLLRHHWFSCGSRRSQVLSGHTPHG